MGAPEKDYQNAQSFCMVDSYVAEYNYENVFNKIKF